MRKLLLAPALVAVVSSLVLQGSAEAADTAVTFTVSAGALSLSGAPSAALSNATATVAGTSVSGQLGSTTVTDNRAAAAGAWSVSVSSTNFTAAGGLSIAKAQASAYSGISTATTGVSVFVPTTAANPVNLGSAGTIASATGILGSSTVTYNPTLTVTIGNSVQAGDYSGTVTQTVA